MRVDRVKLVTEMTRREIRSKELSEKSGVYRATISAMRGGKSCSADTVQRVARALGVAVDSLLVRGKGC